MGGIIFGWLAVWIPTQTGSVANWSYAAFVRRLGEAVTPGGGECGPCPDCIEYPGICLTTEENHG